MTDLLSRLRSLEQPIRIGVIGIGSIGKGIVYQATITPGIQCVAIADLNLPKAIQWAEYLGLNYQVVETASAMEDAIQQGKLTICEDTSLISGCEAVDVQVDACSDIAMGLIYAETAINHHKHIVMMNSEADLTFGPYLLALANKEGVVYTSADGDQHTVIKRLINDVELMGFKTVMAGNIKGYLDRTSNPTAIIPEADKRFMDYKMCASYTDGTKLNIEMALVANGIGARVMQPGMYGPYVKDIYDVFSFFDFDALWDGTTPIADYTIGTQPSGGVFVIGFNDHPHQQETLAWYPCRLGVGPFYVFHRPYHLGHFEIMASIAEAYLDNWGILQPNFGFCTNVYAYAKKDLKAGEILDGVGGYTSYGLIENCTENQQTLGLPICLAENVSLRRDIKQDEKIFMGDILRRSSDERFKVYALEMDSKI